MSEAQTDIIGPNDEIPEVKDLAVVSDTGEITFTKRPPVDDKLIDLTHRVAKGMEIATIAVGKICRGNYGNSFAVALQALRWKMDPFAISHECYDVKGNLAYSGKLIKAVIDANAPIKTRLNYKYEGDIKDGTRQLTVYATFEGEDEPKEYTSPMIKDIRVKNSPLWKDDPDQQLGYYSARNWARRHAPDIMMGILSVDEAETIPVRDVTPREIKPLDIGLEDLSTDTKSQEEVIPDAEVIDEADVKPAENDAGKSDNDTQAEDDSDNEASERPAILATFDMFIAAPNPNAMAKAWKAWLKEQTSAPDVIAIWGQLQTHEAFKALPDDASSYMSRAVNSVVEDLEAESPQ